MGTLGMILMVVGGIAMLVFGIQLLIIAFKTSIGWGLASLFIPLVLFIFVAMHWQQCKTPFLRWLLAAVVYGVGAGMSIAGGGSMSPM
ncbi:MAG: hypothetical protein R2991_04525 [Thermoanaerobaculia bacterium]